MMMTNLCGALLLGVVGLLLGGTTPGGECLDNGLALTPPMGWLAWERFRCVVDCKTYPDTCISEKLFMSMADHLVADGYRDLGYVYVNIDDCWMSKQRDKSGRLQADPDRFPSGIKKLADYVHEKGLKLGIYGDFGNYTCAGYPGSEYNLELDANTFAEWGVDMLKLDGCYSEVKDMDTGYPAMSQFLNKTGRPILFSCSWPAYEVSSGVKPDYMRIRKYCNAWRNYGDIQDSWASVEGIINWYGVHIAEMTPASGPGGWNDPDMLIVGDFSLSYEQSRTQLAMWAVFAAPWFMSNDLRYISTEAKQLLQNKQLIAVNQDSRGVMGQKRDIPSITETNVEVWVRNITDVGQYAVAFLNLRTDLPYRFTVNISDLGFVNSLGYAFTDVFTHKNVPPYHWGMNDTFTTTVNPSGGVQFYIAYYSK